MIVPVAARAQDVPSYAAPTYAASTDETIHGRIQSVDGAFNITVADDRGFNDNVELHSGTIINPTGLTLAEGMSVTIEGYNAGSAFDANEIDTPYSYGGPLPTPVYYGPGYWYPGFAYGYGPEFFLSVVIGGSGWHYEHAPFYGRPWNGHAYFGSAVGVAPLDHSRVALTPRKTEPVATRVPTAFAGRSFAGESRYNDANGAGDRPGTTEAQPRIDQPRIEAPRASYSQAPAQRELGAPRGGATSSGYAPRSGGERPAGGNGGGHQAGGQRGGSAHDGGHNH
jgi:hypothetical protein